MMYTEQDLLAINAQQRKRWFILGLPLAFFAALLIFSLITRVQWLADVATVLLGVTLIAGYDLFVKPLHKYQLHLEAMLHGITHELDCVFEALSEDVSEVEGVAFRTMTVICRDEKDKSYERMFYYDCEKTVPAYVRGQKLRLVYHDHQLADVVAVE